MDGPVVKIGVQDACDINAGKTTTFSYSRATKLRHGVMDVVPQSQDYLQIQAPRRRSASFFPRNRKYNCKVVYWAVLVTATCQLQSLTLRHITDQNEGVRASRVSTCDTLVFRSRHSVFRFWQSLGHGLVGRSK